MSHVQCRHCGRPNQASRSRCDHCGRALHPWKKALTGLGVGFAILLFIGIASNAQDNGQETGQGGSRPSSTGTTRGGARSGLPKRTTLPVRPSGAVSVTPPGPAKETPRRNPCRAYGTTTRVDQIAVRIAEKNVTGARRVQATPTLCTWYPEADLMRIALDVAWEGQDFVRYSTRGTLHLSPDDYRWDQGPGNAALRAYRKKKAQDRKKLVIGGLALAAIVAAVAAADGKPTDSDAQAAHPGRRSEVCVVNSTHLSWFRLDYRWGTTGVWRADSIRDGWQLRFTSAEQTQLQVRADVDPTDATEVRTFTLNSRPGRAAASGASCQTGAYFDLVNSGGTVTARARNP